MLLVAFDNWFAMCLKRKIRKHKIVILPAVLHEREIRCLALPEEHTVRVVTGRPIFGPNRNEAILGRRKYEYTGPNECHNLYYSPDKVLKAVQNQYGMGWDGQVEARMRRQMHILRWKT